MSSAKNSPPTDVRRHLLHAMRRILRPVIRLLIRLGIRYDEFADVARGAYIESAIRDGIGGVRHPTREQIAWMTGINRQRVDHYIDDEDALPKEMRTLTPVLVEVLHRWNTDPRFKDSHGDPRELDLFAGDGPRFEDLVSEIDEKADPRLVVEELIQTKSIAYSHTNRLKVLRRHFIWQVRSVASVEHLGYELEHLMGTLEHNSHSADTDSKRLERCVFADKGLPEHLIPEFQAHVRDRASQFLSTLDDWLARYVDMTHAGSQTERVSTGVNVFLYVEPAHDPRPLSALIQPRRKSV